MKINKSITGICLMGIMFLSALVVLPFPAAAESRDTPSWPAPNWEVGDSWQWYEHDTGPHDENCQEVTLVSDPNTVVGSMCSQSDEVDVVESMTVTLVSKDTGIYKVSTKAKIWDNRTWDFTKNANGTAGGLEDSAGTCKWVESITGTTDYKMEHLGSVSGDSDDDFSDTCEVTSGNVGPQSIEGSQATSFSNSPAPQSAKFPMDASATWTVVYESTSDWDWSWTSQGGSAANDGTTTTQYNYGVTVGSGTTSCGISSLNKGEVPDACYVLTHQGDWDRQITSTNGDSSGSGTLDYTRHYAKKVGNWVQFNESEALIAYKYTDFQNTAPSFDTWPTADVVAEEDKPFEFREGVDYVVSDPDPGNAGDLDFDVEVEKSESGMTDLVLTIDDTGTISFTPTQAQVTIDTQHYIVTINVTDNWDEPAGIEQSFNLKIANTPDDPVANTGIATDFELNEGETYTSSWKITDVFEDPDDGYDPDHELDYSVTGNGSLWLTFNADDTVTFEAADGYFPQASLAIRMTLKAEDNTARKAQTTVTATVKHVNHEPIVLADAIDEFEIDEDWHTSTDTKYKASNYGVIDLKDIFEDIDYGNPSYVTGDRISYPTPDMSPDGMLVLKPTSSKFRIEPEENFNGDVDITFYAEDAKGEEAEHTITVTVLPINDIPTLVEDSADPSDKKITIYETEDGDETDPITEYEFTIEYDDPDEGDTISYIWTVKYQDEDGEDQEEELSEDSSTFVFESAFDGMFSSYGCGDYNNSCDDGYEYTISVIAEDKEGAQATPYEWTVYVKNTNRKPSVTGVNIYEYDDELMEKGAAATATDLKDGKTYVFDLAGMVTDPDDPNILSSSRFKAYFIFEDETGAEMFNISTTDVETEIVMGTDVDPGKYTLKVLVDDGEGGKAMDSGTPVEVKKKSSGNGGIGGGSPGFELVFVVAAVVAAVAVISRRRK